MCIRDSASTQLRRSESPRSLRKLTACRRSCVLTILLRATPCAHRPPSLARPAGASASHSRPSIPSAAEHRFRSARRTYAASGKTSARQHRDPGISLQPAFHLSPPRARYRQSCLPKTAPASCRTSLFLEILTHLMAQFSGVRSAIQGAFAWDAGHLYCFFINGGKVFDDYCIASTVEEEGEASADQIHLGELGPVSYTHLRAHETRH